MFREGQEMFRQRPLSVSDIEYLASDVASLLELRARLEADLRVLGGVIAPAVVSGRALNLAGALRALFGPGPAAATGPEPGAVSAGASTEAHAAALDLPGPKSTPLLLSFEEHRPKYQPYQPLTVLGPGQGPLGEASGSEPVVATAEARERDREGRESYAEALETLAAHMPASLAGRVRALDEELKEVSTVCVQ